MSSFEDINIEKNPPVRMMMVAREMCLLLMQWLWMVWPFSIKHKETFDHFFCKEAVDSCARFLDHHKQLNQER
jgi:hypothetical protein